MPSRYLVLLRGINVGGSNVIRMADLRACFESMGFDDVVTYIQSGNVLFNAVRVGRSRLASRIEQGLSACFDYDSCVVLVPHVQLKKIVENAPGDFGRRAGEYRYDVLFLKQPMTAAEAMKSVTTRAGVDEAHAGNGVVYFSRRAEQASRSRLSRIASLPVYQFMTIRNWRTTTKLLDLMEQGRRAERK